MTRPLSITASGNAQISTAQSKFGGSSLYLDGTGDYLNVNSTTELAFGTGDFCMEVWLYKTGGTSYHTIFDMRTSGSDGGGIILGINNVNQIYMYYNFGYRVVTAAISNNTWTHIALARVNGSTRVFINGTQSGSTYADSNNYAQRGLHIGADPLGNYAFPGYMDEVRISKGNGRYSATFTLPSIPFTDDGYTSLLIHADGTNGSTSITDDSSMQSYSQTDTDGLYIADSYFEVDGYYTYQAEGASAVTSQASVTSSGSKVISGSAALSSEFTQSATAGMIKDSTVSMSAEFTQTATISHIFGSDMFAFAEAALSAQASVIKQSNIAVSSQFDVATDISRIIHVSADDFATTTVLVGNNLRVRYSEAAVDAAFSLAADVGFIPGGEIVTCSGSWTSAFDIECKGTRKQNIIDCDVLSEFTQSAIVSKAAGLSSSLEVSASVIASAGKLQDASVTITSAFSVSTSGSILNKRPRYTTAVNNITTSTDQKKLGSHSLYRPDSTSRLDVYPSKDFQIVSNQDFIIEFFYYPTYDQTTGEKYILNARSAGINWWRFGYTATNGYLFFDYWNGSSTTRMIGPASVSSRLELNRWNYIRVQRSGSSMSLYLDNVFYSGTIDTDTYSGDIVPSPEAPTISIGYYASNVATGYYDEFYFATSTTSGGQYPTSYSELTSGAESTTQFLFHFNGNYVDDTHGTQLGQAALSSQAALSVTGSRVISTSATLSSQASLSADANKFGPQSASANLTSAFELSAHIAGISNASASLESAGFVVAAVGRIRPEIASLDVTTDISILGTRSRSINSSIEAAFSLDVSIDSYTPASAVLSSTASLSAAGSKIQNASSSLTNNFVISVTAKRIIPSWKIDSWGRGLTNATTRSAFISNNNSYELASYTETGPSYNLAGFTLIKRDLSRGFITWRVNLPIATAGGNAVIGYDIQEYQGNLYVNFGYQQYPNFYNQMLVIDESDGSIISQFEINQFQRLEKFIIDGDYIYAVGDAYTAAATVPQIVKYNMAGTVQWRKTRTLTSSYSGSSDNVFVRNATVYWSYSITTLANQNSDLYVAKLDPATGASIWTQSFGFIQANMAYVDTSENIYALGSTATPTNANGAIVKLNSSGSVDYVKDLYAPGEVTADASDNLYFISSNSIISLDQTGSPRYKKTWTQASGTTLFRDLVLDGDTLYAFGSTTNSQDTSIRNSIIWQVPADSGGGNVLNVSYAYGTFTYQDQNLALSNVTYSLPSSTSTSYTTSTGYYSYGLNAEPTSNTETVFTYLYAVNATGAWEAVVTQSTTASRFRGFNSQQSSIASLSSTPTRILTSPVTVNATASLAVVSSNVNKTFTLNATCTAAVTAAVQKIKNTPANLQVTATLTTNAIKTARANSQQTASAEASAEALRIKQISSSFQAIATELTAAFKNATGTVLMEVQMTSTAVVRKITDQPMLFVVNTQLTAQGVNTQFGSAQLQSTASTQTVPTYLRHTEIHLSVTANQTTVISKFTGYRSAFNSVVTQITDTENSRIRSTSSAQTATTSLTSNNQIIRLAQANLLVQAQIPFALGGVMVRIEADLLVEGFTLVAGRILNIDPYYQLKIAPESRTLLVLDELRLLAIKQETRVNKIIGYPQ